MASPAKAKTGASFATAFMARAQRIVRFDDYIGRLAELAETQLTRDERRGLARIETRSEDAVFEASLRLSPEMSVHSYQIAGGDGPGEYIDGVYLALSQKALLEGAGNSQLLRRHFALQNAAFDGCVPRDDLRPRLWPDAPCA